MPISSSSASAGAAPTQLCQAGDVSRRRASVASRSGPPKYEACDVLAGVPAGRRRDDPGEPLRRDRHVRRAARREQPLVARRRRRRRSRTRRAGATRRPGSRRPASALRGRCAAAAIASRSATSPVAICTALNATTSVVPSIAPASSAAGTVRTVTPVRLDEERKERRGELDVRREDARSVRQRRGDEADEARDRRADGDRRRRAPRRAERTTPAPPRSTRPTAPSSSGPCASRRAPPGAHPRPAAAAARSSQC